MSSASVENPAGSLALIEAMLDPAVYLDSPDRVEMIETHISWVLLAGDRAYKVRKPVVFPFLDYGSLDRRRAMSEAEVRLGRRLAPEIYRGVRAVVMNPDGSPALAGLDAEGAVEYVVEMNRFDEARTLKSLLGREAVSEEDLRRVARTLADFHRNAEPAPAAQAGVRLAAEAVEDNFTTLLPYAEIVGPETLRAGHDFAVSFLHRYRGLLEQRVSDGWIRDCHGDLRLEQIVLDGTVQIPDPVEFEPALRLIDISADLAFLVMDLHDAGAGHLAQTLIEEGAAAGVDYGGRRLLYFYAAYRAWVRAKVACLRADTAPPGAVAEAETEAARFAKLAIHLGWKSRGTQVLLLCGRSASGKSTLAAELGRRSGLPVFSSDLIRKERLGLAPGESAPPSAYSEPETLAVYEELGARVAVADEGAIVDATFIRRSYRDAFVAAMGPTIPPPLFAQCIAPEQTLLERAARREGEGEEASDAGPDVVAGQRDRAEPLDEVAPERHLVLRTDQSSEASAAQLEAWLNARPAA